MASFFFEGHAGHDEPADGKSPPLKHKEHVYDLNGQISHKVCNKVLLQLLLNISSQFK